MAVDMGRLLSDFISLQATPVNIGNAVQDQINSRGENLYGYGTALAGAMQNITSLAATLNQMPDNAWVRSLGGAGAAKKGSVSN